MSTAFPSPRLVIYSKRDKVRLARLVLENSASLICGLKPNRLGATLCPARRRRRRVVWVFCGWDGLSSNSPDAPSPPASVQFCFVLSEDLSREASVQHRTSWGEDTRCWARLSDWSRGILRCYALSLPGSISSSLVVAWGLFKGLPAGSSWLI